MIAFFFVSFLFVQIVSTAKVELPLGTLEGSEGFSLNRRRFYAFEGVPYARPPLGKHRFKEPVPLKPWMGTWVANTVTRCLQYDQYARPGEDGVVGDEDCLYLNIYTPDLDVTANLDVIVYIHGGAFMFNYAALYGPDFLMDRDVVYVNFNYRLGPLGFLSTESDLVPGNNGIKDQILALQFVKSYIEYFGGNPNSITLIGNSAGGASVHLHYLTPKSKNLFNRGFSQSGTALNPWVLMENGNKKFHKLASLVGCKNSSQSTEHEMVECLKRRPGKQIVATVRHFQHFLYNPFSPFGVVVDGYWSRDPVLPEYPYSLLKLGRVHKKPYLLSHTNSEGLYPFGFFYPDDYLQQIDKRWNEIIPHVLDYNYTVVPELRDVVSQKIRLHYLGSASLTKENFLDLVKVGTDRIFVHGIAKTAKLHTMYSKSAAFFYYFTYRGAQSKSVGVTKTTIDFGASHADDPCYFLSYKNLDFASNEQDRRMVELFLDLVTSFASMGRPRVGNVTWPRLDQKQGGSITRLVINSPTDLKVDSVDYNEVETFWESLGFEENEGVFDIPEDIPLKDEL